mmetsp:Transcript_30261/g.69350  ORF Transcript_30261/g.69350 Transcript_30261/m.69350 type:complete len:172 (+) Transcript_30261:217-732(+)
MAPLPKFHVLIFRLIEWLCSLCNYFLNAKLFLLENLLYGHSLQSRLYYIHANIFLRNSLAHWLGLLMFVALNRKLIRVVNLFIPTCFRIINYISSNIADLFVRKSSTESRHSILSVSNLSYNRGFFTATSKVLVKSFLLKSFLWHYDILSASMTDSAIGRKNSFSSANISC